MKKPQWLDQTIDKVIQSGDPTQIAQAIANSPRFIDGIKKGLANKPKPGVMGPSYAQNVADALKAEMTAD
jgi:hypothetical protein